MVMFCPKLERSAKSSLTDGQMDATKCIISLLLYIYVVNKNRCFCSAGITSILVKMYRTYGVDDESIIPKTAEPLPVDIRPIWTLHYNPKLAGFLNPKPM